MANIMLAFYKGKKSENPDTTFFDRLICFVTGSRYSHVELVYYFVKESNVGYCWTASPRDGGVRHAVIQFNNEHWELFEYHGKLPAFLKDATKPEIVAWFKPKEGMKYDWVGAVGTVIRLIKQIETKYFCSEIIGEFFGLVKPHLLTPKKLFRQLSFYLTRVQLT